MVINAVFRRQFIYSTVCMSLLGAVLLTWTPPATATPGDDLPASDASTHTADLDTTSTFDTPSDPDLSNSEAIPPLHPLVNPDPLDISDYLDDPDRAYLTDYAQLLTPSQEHTLVQYLRAASAKHNIQLSVVFVSWGRYPFREAAEEHFDDKHLGYGARRDGLLLYVATDSRDMHLVSNGKSHDILRREGLRRVGFSVREVLSHEKWYDAVVEFISASDQEFSAYQEHSFIFPREQSEILPAVLIALIGAGVGAEYGRRKLAAKIQTSSSNAAGFQPLFLAFNVEQSTDTLTRSRSTSRRRVHYDSHSRSDSWRRSSASGKSRSSSSGSWRSSSSSSRGGFSSKF
ncbi:TPM domain-containing protein [Schaalia canis]|nr:TPM domain-containing protein [Schaalia canis]